MKKTIFAFFLILILIIVGCATKNCEDLDYSKRDMCYFKLAIEEKDPKICEKVTDPSFHEYCYRDIAIAKKDLSICNEIVSYETKTKIECYDKLGDDKLVLSVCEGGKSQCFIDLFNVKDDPEICEKLKKQIDKDYCYFGYGTHIARSKQEYDISICEKIVNIEIKDNCYKEQATNFETCEKINDNIHKKQCYINVERRKNY